MAKKIVKTQPDMTLEEAGYDYKSLAGEIGQAARDTQTYLKEASAAVEQWLSIEDLCERPVCLPGLNGWWHFCPP